MKIEKTERGFEVIEFKDIYGNECSLQQSSIALCENPGTSAIWFGTEKDRMHINLKLLKELLPYLQSWEKSGSFYKSEEKMNEIVNDILLKKAIECYELMDQTGLLRLKQAFEADLINNIDTEAGVIFASMREQVIGGILEEQEKQWESGKIDGYKKT